MRHTSTKGGKISDEKIWLFQHILDNPLFRFRNMDWVPHSPMEKNTTKGDIFNTFTGFQATYNQVWDYDLIEPIIRHIKEVWCCNKEEYFNYIIQWLATCVQSPRTRLPALVILGDEGIGKTCIIEWLLKYVFGLNCTAALNNLDEFLGGYNSILANKFMIYISENQGTQHSDGALWNKMEQFKSLITDERITIKTKYINNYQVSNYIRWIMTSNHLDSLRLSSDNRRFAIFQAANTYQNNGEYFFRLHEILNQESADHMYNFLMNFKITNDLRIILQTEAVQEIKGFSKQNAVIFWEELIEKSWKPILNYQVKFYESENVKEVRIIKQDLYNLYRNWCHDKGTKATSDGWFYQYLKKAKINKDGTRTTEGYNTWLIPTEVADNMKFTTNPSIKPINLSL